MRWSQLFFYILAVLDFAMSNYVRWAESNRGEAGYWMSQAILFFLVGYILFRREPQHGRNDG